METATLLALGAAGGSLRGLVDAYNQTMGWQAARREHRKNPATSSGQEVPRFREFFDPVPDVVAAVFHTVLGSAAAAMFGMSGQISGAYAAIAVGISAPAVLTQLGRVQSVSEAIAGGTTPQPNASTGTAPPVPGQATSPTAQSAPSASAAAHGVQQEETA